MALTAIHVSSPTQLLKCAACNTAIHAGCGPESSVCYDRANAYMLSKLRGTYYHYGEIDAATVAQLLSADSIGRFYNANIKGDGWDGPFDCRTRRVPAR